MRHKIVVISDLHLGIDDRYMETTNNRPYLIEFLQRIKKTDDIMELVIAGDFLDEWYLPIYYPSHTDSDQFYRDCIANNQEVIDELNEIIQAGIRVVYVPGNHDLLLNDYILEEAIPGIIQARDVLGLGTYYTGKNNEIVIEHGHRYDVFSAPDTLTNAHLVGDNQTYLPSGYFYARYAATWILEGSPTVARTLPVITTEPDASDVDQHDAFRYYQTVKAVTYRLTIHEPIEEKVFDIRMDGYNDTYSFLDYYPVLNEDGTISAPVLYPNIQRTWDARQELNQVKKKMSFGQAVVGALNPSYFSLQAKTQYFDNPDEHVDMVIFGHTHAPGIDLYDNNKVYVNSGTWVDHNNVNEKATRTFVVIETAVNNRVVIYKYMEDSTIVDFSTILNEDKKEQ